jgi:hypothetical protein
MYFLQQYPTGFFAAQDIFNEFPTIKAVTENGKEVRRAGGSEGVGGSPYFFM